jgi:hypothetical protein
MYTENNYTIYKQYETSFLSGWVGFSVLPIESRNVCRNEWNTAAGNNIKLYKDFNTVKYVCSV